MLNLIDPIAIYGAFSYLPFYQMQWLESEILRLNHLRDLANEKGRKKEYPFLIIIFYFELLQ